jgi:hypothetical protein
MTPIAILRDIQFIFDCYKHPAQSEYYVFIYDMNQPLPTRIGIQPDAEQALTLRIFRASENPTPDTLHQFCQRFLDDAPFRIAWIRRKQEELEKFKATQAALDN